jgi:hypothetical protein
MTIRKSTENANRTYSNSADLAQIEYEMAIILYICGLDGSSIDSYEIDTVVDKIKNTFKFKNPNSVGEPIAVPGSEALPAPYVYIKKLSRQLALSYRRNFRWRKISLHAGGLL